MTIEHIGGCDPYVLATDLRQMANASRFSFEVILPRCGSYNQRIELKSIRLKTSKEYCGSHPGACELAFREHRNRKYLEGADWVEFNDMLNIYMDTNQISCVIWSAPMERQVSQRGERMRIRIGMHRRINYDMRHLEGPFRGNATWELNGELKDFDVAGPDKDLIRYSTFPEGTPGIHVGLKYSCVG